LKPHAQTEVRTAVSAKRCHLNRHVCQMEVDIEEYQALLDDLSLDAKQKADFLAALWSIIVAFVDLGYRVYPVQQAIDDFPVLEDMNRSVLHAVEAHWREAA
jgi:hypothetical protein